MKSKTYCYTLILLTVVIMVSCKNEVKKKTESVPIFTAVSNVPEIEYNMVNGIAQRQNLFLNTVTNDSVTVVHHLQNTAFHFYNNVKFKTTNKGVLVGGAGLRVRLTENAGSTWNEVSFSKFANTFHSASFNGNSLFVVGESKFIFRSNDFGKNWSVFDVSKFGKENFSPEFKFYKVVFANEKTGFITGEKNNKPIVLKTTNGGDNWSIINSSSFDDTERGISDFKALSQSELLIVTLSGKCFKSNNGGTNWEVIYSNENESISLNSMDFKNSMLGYIGGLNGILLKTEDGGKNWTEIKVPQNELKNIISNIKIIKDDVLITTAKSYNDTERPTFVYRLNETEIKPLLTKENKAIYFKGDCYGIDLIDNTLYILDRNNLYSTNYTPATKNE